MRWDAALCGIEQTALKHCLMREFHWSKCGHQLKLMGANMSSMRIEDRKFTTITRTSVLRHRATYNRQTTKSTSSRDNYKNDRIRN